MGVKFSQLPVASTVAADDYIAVLDTSESILKRTPISHASSGSEYGIGTTTAYGHNKLIDDLSQSSMTSGCALSAHQGNVIANDMGTVELTSKATAAHAVGDYFILVNQFVKCTRAIAVGNTITIGVNCQSTNIGTVLSQLNSNLNSQSQLIGTTPIDPSLGTTITGAIDNLKGGSSIFTNLLWSNPSPSTAMENGYEMKLASRNYAALLIEVASGTTSLSSTAFTLLRKGFSEFLLTWRNTSSGKFYTASRWIYRDSDIKCHVASGIVATEGTDFSFANNRAIPVNIWGVN